MRRNDSALPRSRVPAENLHRLSVDLFTTVDMPLTVESDWRRNHGHMQGISVADSLLNLHYPRGRWRHNRVLLRPFD